MHTRQPLTHGRSLLLSMWIGVVPWLAPSSAAAQSTPEEIVVESVVVRSAGARAGVVADDRLTAWAAADGASERPIKSVFDMFELEVEHTPRAPFILVGRRGDAPMRWSAERGILGLTARPAMQGDLLAFYLEGRSLVAAKRTADAAAHWSQMATRISASPTPLTSVWLLARAGVVLTDLRVWEAADAHLAAARRLAEPLQLPRVMAYLHRQQGRSYQARSDWARATASYEQALALDCAGPSPTMACAADHEAVGLVVQNRGGEASAEASYKRALAIREALAPDSAELANTLNNLASTFTIRGDLAGGDAYRKRAVSILERVAPNTLMLANALHNVGVVAHDRGDLATAEQYYKQGLAIREVVVPDSLLIANSFNSLALVAGDRGDLDAAEAQHKRALAIREREAPGSLDVSASLGNLGILMRRRGDLRAAERYQRDALAIKERLAPGSLDVSGTLNNIGNIYFDRGQYAEAETAHRQALAIREQLSPGTLVVALSLNNLGNVAIQRYDLDRAREFYQRSLAIKEKVAPLSTTMVTTLNNLGSLATMKKEFVVASGHHRRALSILDKVAPANVDRINTLFLLGTAELSMKNYADARTHATAAVEMGEKVAPASNWTSQSLLLRSQVALAAKDLPAALASAERSVAVVEASAPGTFAHTEAINGLGDVHRAAGRREQALAAYSEAIDHFERLTTKVGGARDIRSGFRAKGAPDYRSAVNVALALGRPELAFDLQERYRSRSLLLMMAERDLQLTGDLPVTIVAGIAGMDAEYDRVTAALSRVAPADKAETNRLVARLRELRDAREDLVRRARRESPRYAALQYPEALDLAATRRALEPGTALLSYWVDDDRTLLFVVQASGLTVVPIKATERQLRTSVREFRTALQSASAHQPRVRAVGGITGKTAATDLSVSSSRLYDLLIRPARAAITASQRLLIVPDGPLHALPFGALKPAAAPGGRSRYLIESKAVHIAASATLANDAKGAQPAATAKTSRLVAFGDPDFASSGGAIAATDAGTTAATRGLKLARLPMAKEEVQAIAKLFGSSATVYVGAEATEARAKAAGAGATHLHFASHAMLDERLPLNSALVLAPSGKNADRTGENGLLQVWEIFEGMRLDLDLVTLSGCETALGEEFGGEGLLGLTRAFQYAGARSVVASLWSIPDASTSELMVRFYRYLRAGRSKDEALRAAQIDAIGSAGTYSHPFHWAAFQLFGDRR